MELGDILPAIGHVHESTPGHGSRAATYLRTYPAILATAAVEGVDASIKFSQLATMAYGWMPRVLRLDSDHLPDSIEALQLAQNSTEVTWTRVPINDIAQSLHSVVGASKLLHFAMPHLFPIWDKKVESFRLGQEPMQFHMTRAENYTAFVEEVHDIRRDARFVDFHEEFNQAFIGRLVRLRIDPYHLSEVRAVELAVFELAGGDDDGT